MIKTLLPPNATKLERDIEQVTAAKYDVPDHIRDVWNADTCPAHLLPWLAWAMSVDNWDSQWPEQVKRDTIKNSIAVHQRKGTVAAVRTALDALGVQVEISEWWQTNGVAGTFDLLAWANSNLGDGTAVLSQKLYADLEQSIKEAAPVSRHFAFKVGAQFKDTLGLAAGAIKTTMVNRNTANTDTAPLQSFSALTIAAHAHVHTVARLGVL